MCPPLDGPGVPPERVEAVSSWSLFHEVCAERERETESKAHNQASDHRKTCTRYSPIFKRQLALSDVPHFGVFHPLISVPTTSHSTSISKAYKTYGPNPVTEH